MRLFFIFFICLSQYFSLFAQKNISGILRDSLSKQPIEFANIGIIGKNIGTVTNEKGAFSFNIPDSLLNETIMISIIGYQPKSFSALNFNQGSVIQLDRYVTLLAEVEIKPRNTKIKILGNDTKTKSVSTLFNKNNLGAEIAIRLRVKHEGTELRKFMVNINRNTLGLPIFRFNVYSVGKDGMPAENLLKQNILIEPKEKTGLIELDLIPFGIILNTDIFIAIEWIKDLGNVSGLEFSTKLVGSATYFRQASQGQWEKVSPIGVGLHVEVGY